MSRKDELEGQLSQRASEHAEWRGLLDHPGWKKFAALIEQQVRLRQATICLTPLESFGKTLEQEFMKGEAVGFGSAMALPETLAEQARLDVTRLTAEIELESTHETQRNTNAGSRVDNDDFSRE